MKLLFLLFIICSLLLLLVNANDVNRRRIYNNVMAKNNNNIRDNENLEADNYIPQILDHFAPLSSQTTFPQRFFVNQSFYKSGGPAFLIIGGESAISSGYVTRTQISNMAEDFGAIVLALEHRFYGLSTPFPTLDSNTLPYLTTQQALADVAYFQQQAIQLYNISQDTKWVVFGCSYSGAMSAWFKLKFPNLVTASFAGSAPVEAVLSFYQYDQVNANSLGSECAAPIRNATLLIQDLLLANESSNLAIRQRLQCESVNDPVAVLYALADAVAYVVQYNANIEQMCSNFKNSTNLVDTYVDFMTYFYNTTGDSCSSLDISSYTNETYDPNGMLRQWMWQSCDELGYFQTAPANNSLRSTLIDANWHIQVCKKLFGNYTVGPKIAWTNSFYGGNNSLVTSNTIFTNGKLDPWQALSVTTDLSFSVPAIIVDETAHCANFHYPQPNDPQSLVTAREQVSNYLSAFLNDCGGCGAEGVCTYKRSNKGSGVDSTCACVGGKSGTNCEKASSKEGGVPWWSLVILGVGVVVALALGIFIGVRISKSRKYETI